VADALADLVCRWRLEYVMAGDAPQWPVVPPFGKAAADLLQLIPSYTKSKLCSRGTPSARVRPGVLHDKGACGHTESVRRLASHDARPALLRREVGDRVTAKGTLAVHLGRGGEQRQV
jgi:hypothetical protein